MRRRAEIILLLMTLIWGATFPILKSLVDGGMAPIAIVAWRFSIAAVVFAIAFGNRLGGLRRRVTRVHGAVLGFLLYLGFGLQTIGLEETSSSRSGFITALYVIFTPLLQVFVTRRAPTRRVAVGIAFVLLGLWGLTAPGGVVSGLIDPWREGGFNVGDLQTLGSAFFFAVYIVLLQRYTREGDINGLTATQLITVSVVASAHLAIHALVAGGVGALVPRDALGWTGLLYLAVMASVIATYLHTRYQRDTTPSRAAVIFTLESVFAAAIAAAALNERLTPLSLAGGALIITGLLVVELGSGNAEVTADAEGVVARSGEPVLDPRRPLEPVEKT